MVDHAGRWIAHRYRVEGIVGRGGMGTVFRAVDRSTGSTVALKRMTASGAPGTILRFRREFHTLAQLRHPRIVEVFDFGFDGDVPFYTMELLEGADLKQRSPMPPREACRVLRDVAAGLALLHARGLVHRDITPRNVRYGTEGEVKLIDFGALATVGAAPELVGTPSYTAPEAVYGGLVDGRSDLYALGALAYVLLTGRPPYPAAAFDELAEVWHDPLQPPSTFQPATSDVLDELVLELLCLNPQGRPPSAAVVMDRLTAAGGLFPDPPLAVARGYLASVAMVGRTAETECLRDALRAASGGTPRVAFVEGPAGMGKSRLLGELAREAKVAGARVAATSCESSPQGPYGTLGSLIRELALAHPDLADRVPHEARGHLARVLPWWADELGEAAHAVADPGEERLRVQRALYDTILAFAQDRLVVLTVDDLHRADEASAAVLAALARRTDPAPLMLAVGLRSREPLRAPAAVAAMAASGSRLVLEGLGPGDTEALVRATFGDDLMGCERLARWLYRHAGGSPMLSHELLRHLVDAGHIRYAQGTWVLPPTLDDLAPPRSLAAAMEHRVARLAPETRALAEVLAMRAGQIPLADGVALAGDGRPEGVFAAFDELVREGVLLEAEGTFAFRHDGLREALLAGLDDDRRRALHLRVAEQMMAGAVDADRKAEIGWHLLRGGERSRGAALLEQAGTRLYESQALRDCLAPLEAALEVLREEDVPEERRLALELMLLAAGWVADREVGARYARSTVEAFRERAGIATAESAGRILGRQAGLVAGMGVASMRWFGRRRGPTPLDAFASFSMALGYACGLTYAANRRDEVEALAELTEPLAAFEHRLPYATYLGIHAFPAILTGRFGAARRWISDALELLATDTSTSVSEWDRRFAEAGLRGLRVIVDINQFNRTIFDDLEAIDRLGFRYYQLVAQTAWVAYHRHRGEEARAVDLEQRLEATSLQLGSWSTDLQLLLFAHPAYGLTGDITGLHRCAKQLAHFIDEGFGFHERLALTRGEIHRLRGEHAQARELLEPCLAHARPDDFLVRQWVGSALAEVELGAKRFPQAAAVAAATVELGQSDDHGLLLPRLRAERILALATFEMGDVGGAVERLEAATEVAEALDCPILAGMLHEAQAFVALGEGDRDGFVRHAECTARWFLPTDNPFLIGRHERLVRRGLGRATSHPPLASGDEATTARHDVTLDDRTRLR